MKRLDNLNQRLTNTQKDIHGLLYNLIWILIGVLLYIFVPTFGILQVSSFGILMILVSIPSLIRLWKRDEEA